MALAEQSGAQETAANELRLLEKRWVNLAADLVDMRRTVSWHFEDLKAMLAESRYAVRTSSNIGGLATAIADAEALLAAVDIELGKTSTAMDPILARQQASPACPGA